MSDITRSIVTGGIVVLSIGAIVAGLIVRDHQELGGTSPATEAQVGGLIASKDGVQVPADRFFDQMVEKLKREYVDPIDDDQKLASGSVRGMVASLNDPNSVFMDPKEFASYQKELSGHYEGIGADLSLEDSHGPASTGQTAKPDSASEEAAAGEITIPRLTVVGLTPSGPAAKAGVKLGDSVEFVDGRWLIQAKPIQALRDLTDKVTKKKAPMSALIQMRKELRPKLDKSVLPLRAKDQLMLGDSGSATVIWRRGEQLITTDLKRERSEMSTLVEPAGTLHLAFGPDAPKLLKEAIRGKNTITLDLRNDPIGEFTIMKQCLAVVAPSGSYGMLDSERAGKSHALEIIGGNSAPPKLTLLVDQSTRGVAEIFALALQSKGLAKIDGGPMAGHRYVIETVALPDGSGYSLVTGKYRPASEKSAQAEPPKRKRRTPLVATSFGTEIDI
jgi:carboxyl-terminal processing protease